MYGKIFSVIYDGSLAEDWRALITFQQLIVLCDADGVVDMTPTAISRRTGIPIEHIKAGLEILEQPDPESRTPDEEGRRICRIDGHNSWGWYLVNHAKYRALVDADTVREQTRERVRRYRATLGLSASDANPVTVAPLPTVTDRYSNARTVTVTHGNGSKRHTDTDTDTDTDTYTDTDISSKHSVEVSTVRAKENYSADFEEFWLAYPSPRRGNKKRAFAEWKKVTADKQFVIGDIKNRIERDQLFTDEQGKFVPHAERWLSGERWETGIKEASYWGAVTDRNIQNAKEWLQEGVE